MKEEAKTPQVETEKPEIQVDQVIQEAMDALEAERSTKDILRIIQNVRDETGKAFGKIWKGVKKAMTGSSYPAWARAVMVVGGLTVAGAAIQNCDLDPQNGRPDAAETRNPDGDKAEGNGGNDDPPEFGQIQSALTLAELQDLTFLTKAEWAELEDGKPLITEVEGKKVVVVNNNGTIFYVEGDTLEECLPDPADPQPTRTALVFDLSEVPTPPTGPVIDIVFYEGPMGPMDSKCIFLQDGILWLGNALHISGVITVENVSEYDSHPNLLLAQELVINRDASGDYYLYYKIGNSSEWVARRNITTGDPPELVLIHTDNCGLPSESETGGGTVISLDNGGICELYKSDGMDASWTSTDCLVSGPPCLEGSHPRLDGTEPVLVVAIPDGSGNLETYFADRCRNGVCDPGEDSVACPDDCGGPVCPNGVAETGEECDTTDMGGNTCESEGFTGGTLTCFPDCTLNTTSCTTCPNGICETGEDLTNCEEDCSVCGDGQCTGSEDLATCEEDCSVCGDGQCTGSEDLGNCEEDCSVCGDGQCTGSEDLANCEEDCSVCGDGQCTGSEDLATCEEDCSVCGDGQCTGSEDLATCEEDCSVCGDGQCTGSEDLATCEEDCSVCGDGQCTGSEDLATCEEDCSVCGDDQCTGSENAINCGEDCSICGDGQCTGSENAINCGEDCSICGDGQCTGSENAINCGEDCSICGDDLCTGTENATDCPEDCTGCGDGFCTGDETALSCAADCTVCGDGFCTGDETAFSCMVDCTVCGDGQCTGFEDAINCGADCTVCGDEFCTGDENLLTCPMDCVVCGDDICTVGYENLSNCPEDCMDCGDGICTVDYENLSNCPEDCVDCGDGICTVDYENPDNCPEDCGPVPFCGDGEINQADEEECDGEEFGGFSCTDFDFFAGILACTDDCDIDTDGCHNCGDGVLQADEECDPGLGPNCPPDCECSSSLEPDGEGDCKLPTPEVVEATDVTEAEPEPDTVEPDAEKPDVVEAPPEVFEPDADVAEPDITQPPDTEEPDTEQPDVAEAETDAEELPGLETCGNGVVDEGEECDPNSDSENLWGCNRQTCTCDDMFMSDYGEYIPTKPDGNGGCELDITWIAENITPNLKITGGGCGCETPGSTDAPNSNPEVPGTILAAAVLLYVRRKLRSVFRKKSSSL